MKGIRLRPEQSGLKAALFDLEADIMQVVWRAGWQEFSVGDVQQALERQRDIAYTTVMTTVARLYEKGLLSRTRAGRRYVYSPIMSEAEFSKQIGREVLDSLSGLGRDEAMALLVEQVGGSDLDELKKLESLIRRRKKELRG